MYSTTVTRCMHLKPPCDCLGHEQITTVACSSCGRCRLVCKHSLLVDRKYKFQHQKLNLPATANTKTAIEANFNSSVSVVVILMLFLKSIK